MNKLEKNCIATDLYFDHEKLISEYKQIYEQIKQDQIHVSSHDGKTLFFKSGDMRTYDGLKQEQFTKINSWFSGTYIEEVYNKLNEIYDICRGRLMRMDEKNRAYSYHYDMTPRLHIPLVTNEDCLFLVEDEIIKMHDLGRVYLLDTTKKHTALNLSWSERIHFVICLKND